MTVAGSESTLTFRRLVPRYRWPEAADRLRKAAKAPHLAEAHHDHHAVLVRTTRKGAASLDGISTTAPAGIARTAKPLPKPPPEPSPSWAASDPLEAAFKRMQAEAKARAAQLDQEAAA